MDRCGRTGQVWREAEHWQAIAGSSNPETLWGWTSVAGRLRASRRAELIIHAAGLGPESTVLELGCGTGTFTHRFAATGAQVLGIDLIPDHITRATHAQKSRMFWLSVADAHCLPLLSATFDAVVGVSVLHHLELTPALSEIRRVLRPGGLLVFSEPNMMNPQIAVQKNVPAIRRRLGDSPDETAFFRWSMRRRLEQAGFEESSVRPFDFLHPLVPRAAIRTVVWFGQAAERCPIIREFAGSLLVVARRGC